VQAADAIAAQHHEGQAGVSITTTETLKPSPVYLSIAEDSEDAGEWHGEVLLGKGAFIQTRHN
jgi:hypothetical protein